MRSDMAQVLVERARLGGGLKYPRRAELRRVAFDEMPKQESAKFRWVRCAGETKSLNENLAPLRRFLRRRVGCRWDDVYSEICERINRDSAVQLHIWQHLMREVVRDPIEIGRRRHDWWRRGGWTYVDPATGRLQVEPQEHNKRCWRPKPQPFLVEHAGRRYRRVNGLWFEVELGRLPVAGPVWDAVLSPLAEPRPRPVHFDELAGKYARGLYAARKRQLNKKELRRLRSLLDAACA